MATTLKELLESQEETNLRLDEIDDRFLTFFEMVRADKLDMLEMMREIKNVVTPAPALVPPVPPGGGATVAPSIGGLGGFAIGAVATLPALIVGFVEGVFDSIRALFKAFKIPNLFAPITDTLREKFGRGSKIFQFLDDLVVKTYVFFDDYLVKPLTRFGDFIGEQFGKIKSFFDPNGMIGKIFSPISEGFGRVGSIFGSIGETFGKFFGAIRAFGAVLGRLFVPIGIIMSIVDTVKGAIAGFTEEEGSMVDKLIAGLYGGLKGLINGLIMMPLDLLKDGVSWIAGKLGFDNFSEVLDSFSFQDLFSNMVDKVTEIVQKIFRFPVAVTKAGGAALRAAITPGESAMETFTRVFNQTMEGGEAPAVTATATSAQVNEPPPEQVSRPRTRADVRRESMERSATEQAGSSGNVTIVNNTNAPTTVSSSNSTVDMGQALPPATQSNGTRASAYSAA